MIYKRFKSRDLFNGNTVEEDADFVRRILRRHVRDIVATMKAAELDGVFSYEDTERYVVRMFERFETELIPMDGDEFSVWIDGEVERDFRGGF